MTAGSLDTNILARYILDDVPEQTVLAAQLFDNYDIPFDVADAALIELVHMLQHHYEYTRGELIRVLESVIRLENLQCHADFFEDVLVRFERHPKLSFVDCYLATRAEWNGQVPLWTFDKKLAAQVSAARLVA